MNGKKRILSLLLAGALAAVPMTAQAATDLGGTVNSFGSENGKVTLSLLAGNEVVRSITIIGTSSAYAMEGVQDGDYILQASKYNHGTRQYAVTVSGGELIQDVQLCLLGDISGDGRINVGDTAKTYSHVRKTNLLTDDYAQVCADMNGDGRLNVGDTARIYNLVRNPATDAVPALPANPVEDNKNNPILIEGAQTFEADVAPGHLVYYRLSQVNSMKLTVKGDMAYVISNGVTYEAKDGEVTIPELSSANDLIAIGNRSQEAMIFGCNVNYEPGHPLNPIEIGSTLDFDAEVPAGGLVYFNLYRVSETDLTIENPYAYVIYDGVTYEAKDGVVTVPDLYTSNNLTPIEIAIGNRGTSDQIFAASLRYDLGHQMNPIPLSNGNMTTHCEAGNSQGVYYSYTASKEGTLTIRLTQTVDCNITITSGLVEGGTRSVSLSDEEGSTSLSFKMIAGETVSVCIVMTPINGFTYPEGTVATTVRFR